MIGETFWTLCYAVCVWVYVGGLGFNHLYPLKKQRSAEWFDENENDVNQTRWPQQSLDLTG